MLKKKGGYFINPIKRDTNKDLMNMVFELVLVRSDGWQLVAHYPKMYLDGSRLRIEWNYSTGGKFTDQIF